MYIGWPVDPRCKFSLAEVIEPPEAVPAFVGGVLLVTVSGRPPREIKADPAANLDVWP